MSHRPSNNSAIESPSTLPFDQAARARRSYRDFLPEPMPDAAIREVLMDAQQAPSNCNTQPWNVHIVAGKKRDELSQALHRAREAGEITPDFSWDGSAYAGRYADRRREQAAVHKENLGIAPEDRERSAQAAAANFSFFNAPHVALLFMPLVGDGVRIASDLGMYGQTFLLALAARGYGGVPQTVIGLYAETVRRVLGVNDGLKLLYAISFGHPNLAAPANRTRVGRGELGESVTFHR